MGWFKKFFERLDRQGEHAQGLFVVTFIFTLFFGGYYGWTQLFLLTSKSTTGTVIDSWTTTSMDNKGKSSTNTTYKYQFVVDGKTYTFLESESFPAQEKGKTYTIYYDPEDPSSATDGRRGGTFMVFCLGLLVLIVMTIRNREPKRPPGSDV
jgi:hypothetical protein